MIKGVFVNKRLFFLIIAICFVVLVVSGQSTEEISETVRFLQEYLDLHVAIVTASGISESLLLAPASIVVISEEDIQKRGYTDLGEILNDLPGFDVIWALGATYVNAYQRGYRTPWLQRTLLLIDGVEENHLWSHEAMISRQFSISNIKSIEVLYGPASSVYGPNAFLGIINIITKDGSDLKDGETRTISRVIAGDYKIFGVDITTEGRASDFHWAVTGRIYKSDEEDFSKRADEWGFLSPSLLNNRDIWGPILDHDNLGTQLGEYASPTDNYYFHSRIGFKDFEFGFLNWEEREGFGPYYPFDRVQPNAHWNNYSKRFYIKNNKRLDDDLFLNSFFGYRESRKYGQWIEADPWVDISSLSDTTNIPKSTISFTKMNSLNYSWLYKSDLIFNFSDRVKIMGGLKLETKKLTKSYDIPGYYPEAYQSTTTPGEYGNLYDGWLGHSNDTYYEKPPYPSSEMPADNMTRMTDVGSFFQYIYDDNLWRLTAYSL